MMIMMMVMLMMMRMVMDQADQEDHANAIYHFWVHLGWSLNHGSVQTRIHVFHAIISPFWEECRPTALCAGPKFIQIPERTTGCGNYVLAVYQRIVQLVVRRSGLAVWAETKYTLARRSSTEPAHLLPARHPTSSEAAWAQAWKLVTAGHDCKVPLQVGLELNMLGQGL